MIFIFVPQTLRDFPLFDGSQKTDNNLEEIYLSRKIVHQYYPFTYNEIIGTQSQILFKAFNLWKHQD